MWGIERDLHMTDDIIIRIPSDAERKKFYEVYKTGLPGVDDISEERFNRWWAQSQESGLFNKLWRVAVLNDEVVGVVINVVKEEQNCGFVWELAVTPEHRGKGIGSRLISHSEKCLLEYSPAISTLGIGVKTENYRALALYEKLGYGMHFVVLRLQGRRWSSSPHEELSFRRADPSMVDSLLELVPDAYWDSHDRKDWLQFLKEEDQVAVLGDGTIVGFVRLVLEDSKPPITEIPFYVRQGYGESVLDACMDFAKTEIAQVWVQDSHQDIIELLYGKGFRRMESEFLLRKRARQVREQE